MRTYFFVFLLSIFFSSPVYAQTLPGKWEGAITIEDMDLQIVVHFDKKEGKLAATIDIPAQRAKGLDLQNVDYTPPKVYFELAGGPGLAKFDGIRGEEQITGSFTQAGIEGTFFLQKSIEKKVDPETLSYREEEVSFKTVENTFAGTLTIPKKQGKHPAVVLISGSGTQERDSDILGFKTFKIMAEYLSARGIAVLRYDDRGAGGSSNNQADPTSADFAQDVRAAVQYLQTRTDIDGQQIGLLGHSEGGIIAPMVITDKKTPAIAFMISMAGFGVKGAKLMEKQAELIGKATGMSEADLTKVQAFNKKAYTTAEKNEGWEELKEAFYEIMPAQLTEEQKKQAFEMQMQGLKSAWYRYFVGYDPAPVLAKVSCPALLLFGELDLQVSAEQNKDIMLETLKKGGNKEVEVKVFAKANHLFQEAKTGNPNEYATLKKEFIPGFLAYISAWILRYSNPVE